MNRAELKSLIQAQIDDGPAVTYLDQFIEFSEAFFDREVKMREGLEKFEGPATISGQEATLTLPTDFNEARSVIALQSPKVILQLSTPDEITMMERKDGDPMLYALDGADMLISPVPSADIRIRYYKKVPRLSDSVTTNFILEAHPDLYYYRTLVECKAYLNDANLATIADAKVSQILTEVNSREAKNWRNATGRFKRIVP